MTTIEMRGAKRELHKVIVDVILGYDDITNEEMDELWDYVRHLAECELDRAWED